MGLVDACKMLKGDKAIQLELHMRASITASRRETRAGNRTMCVQQLDQACRNNTDGFSLQLLPSRESEIANTDDRGKIDGLVDKL